MKFTRLHIHILACCLLLLAIGRRPCAREIMPTLELDEKEIHPQGQSYTTTVPDTLDLAELARMAINNQVGNLEPEKSYGVYQVFNFGNPPEIGGLTWNLPAQNARTLPWLRTMCGSTQGLDVECGLMRALLGQVREDGLMFVPIDNDGAPKDTAYPYANGLMVLALLNWNARDGRSQWLDVAGRMVAALERTAIQVEDRAYYPPESSLKPDGTWAWTMRGEATIPYRPPEEPHLEQQGLEGCVKFEQSAPLRALVKGYRINQDPKTIETAQRVARFMLKPGMWEDTSAEGYLGHEHGIFAGHFHGNVTSLHALLELAQTLNRPWLKQFVREAYDHGRRTGIARMGWSPGWLRPEKYHRDASLFLASETCGVSDMLLLGVKLSDAGLGDYWDDVDAIVRNHLVAQQITDLDRMRTLAGGDPKHDALLKRFVGGFNQSVENWINSTGPHAWGCCSANGAIGLYYAWHGITRFDEPTRTATVNLLLNRASQWLDIDSYLPYEGKVIIHNKQARKLLVRVPGWVEPDQVRCFVNEKPVRPALAGRYLVFDGLSRKGLFRRGGGEAIRIEFPVSDSIEKHTVGGREYTLTFRSSTLMDITPRSSDPGHYQYYLPQRFEGNKAPMRERTRFVADKTLPLQ